jgi:hypothetical protein
MTWIRSNLGMIAGIILTLSIVGLVVWDWGFRGEHGGHLPPGWHGGDVFVPEHQEVCPGVDLERVKAHSAVWSKACWPDWPEPVMVDAEVCDGTPAPDGTARWHPCAELRLDDDGTHFPPCVNADNPESLRSGTTHTRIRNGEIVAADLYVWLEDPFPRDCVYDHEGGHGRGITTRDGTDSHTTLHHSLMYGDGCREDYTMVWLDRCEGGDWPHETPAEEAEEAEAPTDEPEGAEPEPEGAEPEPEGAESAEATDEG